MNKDDLENSKQNDPIGDALTDSITEQLKAGINPDEVQKELEDLVKSKFGDNVKVVTQPLEFDPLDPEFNMSDESNEAEEPKQELNLEFDKKPKQVFEYLNDFVIGQEEAKKTLAVAICDHYNHIKKHRSGELKTSHYAKQNVLMLGPTGVGKTYLIKKVAELIGVPFVKADATKFTEAGYVGANVDDTIRDLITHANGNVELAQYGIVYIDEADKLAGTRRINGKDISGRGVQNGLLKLLEETDVDTKSPFDMMAQMNSMLMGKKDKMPKTISTKNILFIMSGAFSGLEDVIKKRMNVSTIGFGKKENKQKELDNLFKYVETKDLVEFGFEPELIGRLPVRVHCNQLKEKDLFHILKDTKESIIYQYQDAFDSYEIELDFTDCALEEIARQAKLENTGARSLMTIIEKTLREYKFELPSCEISYLKVDKALVQNPEKILKDLISTYS